MSESTPLENAHLLIRAITNAIARGCIHRDPSGKVLRTPLEVLNVLRTDQQVLVEEPPPEVTERLAFIERLYPKDQCYRNRGDARHHFKIHSYEVGQTHSCSEPGCTHETDPTVVTVTLIHGSDSSLPGVAAMGFDPKILMACGCSKWEFPSDEQVARTRAYIESQRRQKVRR